MLERPRDFLGLVACDAPCLSAVQQADQRPQLNTGRQLPSGPAGTRTTDAWSWHLRATTLAAARRHGERHRNLPATPQSRPSKRKIDDISDSGERGSDRPTRPSPTTPRPPGGPEVGWLVSVSLAAWARDKSGEEGSKSGEGASSSEGAPASPVELPHRPHKRLRHDPVRHRSCMGLSELTGPDAVRYHVLSRHRKPLHCPRCYAVFVKHADRDRHIVHRACGPGREPRADVLAGVSAAQAVELARMRRQPGGSGSGPHGRNADLPLVSNLGRLVPGPAQA
ncbi:hypothetical protein MAPG_05889 [Magnaporthiopsis poae ATCC 64411]|uniref:Uncharacterized protein n=1 Tax=Magnaporthiopsis poae (strain ATCC 64411 / 73-15) TaxID=644358 RepID=A0A0C4E0L0_MAGP6|nr:hypothetical protein MAPG_05889 [Magnaporthiopsis poae ATCC 64411]